MILRYSYQDGVKKYEGTSSPKPNSWINAVNPTPEEIRELVSKFNLDPEIITASLDSEERSRIDIDEDYTFIIINASIKKESKYDKSTYNTIPIGIIIKDNDLITICQEELDIFARITDNARICQKLTSPSKIIIKLFDEIIKMYLRNLRTVDVRTNEVENILYKNEGSKEHLLELLNMEKTLIYFITALSGNDIVVRRIIRSNMLNLSEEGLEELEDILIEMQQASEMARVNSTIINSIRSAFEAINNNSLNLVMKVLASITIVINIPMFITSFFGMNVEFPPIVKHSIFLYTLCVFMFIITYITYKIMKKRKLV